MADKDELDEAKEAFKQAYDAESENREAALDDLKFARLGEQWPANVTKQRQLERRPCLTINKMPSIIRQVVNDARQNKPSIRVRPVDSDADPETADVMNGLIRNIEQISNADVAYDTAADFAITQGLGYFRIGIEYADDDSFDKDILIKRVANPFSVYGDPHSTEADSSDWNCAFITDLMTKDAFKAEYKGAEQVDWSALGYDILDDMWRRENSILVAEYWCREKVDRPILLLSSGEILEADIYEKHKDYFDLVGVTVTSERVTKSHKVTQKIMTGAEILETNEWAGKYIPIVPVYGEEVNVEGKRHFRSLIRDAKDAQRMFNYWRTAATELVALAPKAPYIGPEEAFAGDDGEKWARANTETFAYLSYKGQTPPQRQPFAGPPAGALQEALNASDDMKAITGLYDASLGARSNETSGRAIMARQREGDVSTFHFIDNLSRAIRHGGRILIDLIPKVYTGERIVRVLGKEGEVKNVQLGKKPDPTDQTQMRQPQAQGPMPQGMPGQQIEGDAEQQAEIAKIYDLTVGKYDLVVDVGPSFTTRREEAATQMMELLRAFPDAAPVIGDLLAKNLDWPGADEIAERLQKMQQNTSAGVDPKKVAAMQQELQQLQQENAQLKADVAGKQVDRQIEGQRVGIEQFDAQTNRIKAMADIARPQPQPAQARI